MRYFTKVTADHWTAKNNLEKEWKEICRGSECQILENEEQKEQYIHGLKTACIALNAKHARCKSLAFSDWTPANTNITLVGVSYVSTISIYQEKTPF